ncbi:MAG: Ig-like domain-containing protein [Myxococcota bacterium]
MLLEFQLLLAAMADGVDLREDTAGAHPGPTYRLVFPSAGSQDIPVDVQISVAFDEAIDVSTLTDNSTFGLQGRV